MTTKPYSEEIKDADIVCEPPAFYGPAIQLDPNRRYTYADYLGWTDHVRRELVDGFVRMMSGVTAAHSVVTVNLTGIFWQFVKRRKGKCKVIHAPFDVRLPTDGETGNDKIYTVVQPDILVVCDPKKIDEYGCLGAPDLVVEVQSPSTARYVMGKKFDLYEKAGVKEYWVVYPKAGLTVFLLQDNGKYDDGTTYDIIYMPDAKVPVHTVEGLEISLRELFED